MVHRRLGNTEEAGAIWTILQANITSYSNFADLVVEHEVDAYCCQELCRDTEGTDEARASSNAIGMHVLANASVRTDKGGLSAGAMVASKWQYPLAPIHVPGLLLHLSTDSVQGFGMQW